jgi:hypothetical protein
LDNVRKQKTKTWQTVTQCTHPSLLDFCFTTRVVFQVSLSPVDTASASARNKRAEFVPPTCFSPITLSPRLLVISLLHLRSRIRPLHGLYLDLRACGCCRGCGRRRMARRSTQMGLCLCISQARDGLLLRLLLALRLKKWRISYSVPRSQCAKKAYTPRIQNSPRATPRPGGKSP